MLLIKHTKIETCKSPVIRERHLQDLPGHLAAKTLYFHCRGHGFDPQWGSQDLKYQAPWPKKFIKLKKKKGTFIGNSGRNSQALALLSQMGNPGLGQLSNCPVRHPTCQSPPRAGAPLLAPLPGCAQKSLNLTLDTSPETFRCPWKPSPLGRLASRFPPCRPELTLAPCTFPPGVPAPVESSVILQVLAHLSPPTRSPPGFPESGSSPPSTPLA